MYLLPRGRPIITFTKMDDGGKLYQTVDLDAGYN